MSAMLTPDATPGPPGRRGLGTTRGRWLVAAFVMALLVAVAIPMVSMGRMLIGPPPATAGQLASAGPGDRLDVAIEVSGPVANGLASGVVLEQVESGTYRPTGQVVHVRFSTQAPVVMGQVRDIRDGAVIQVRGQLSSAGDLVAERIVILTGSVRVE
jgi:hypothetical protein